MGCADVCLSDADYDGNEFHHDKIVTARKPHVCEECGCAIEPGKCYERVAGKNSNGLFTIATCLVCREIREAFTCGSWIYGDLWERMREDMFPVWRKLGPWECLAKLATPAAVTECVEWFNEQMQDEADNAK